MPGLTRPQIYKVVNDYIGVNSGYLGDFSYRTHAEFYPYYCDLDIDTDEYEGTTRKRFLTILENANERDQAKILRGVLSKYPPNSQEKQDIAQEIEGWAECLESTLAVVELNFETQAETVQRVIEDARILINNRDAISAVDRVHTALHGLLICTCKEANLEFESNSTMPKLLKVLKNNHPAFSDLGHRSNDISKVLNSMATILDALNPIRNRASVAHPNDQLISATEANLVINTAYTLLNYLDEKHREWERLRE